MVPLDRCVSRGTERRATRYFSEAGGDNQRSRTSRGHRYIYIYRRYICVLHTYICIYIKIQRDWVQGIALHGDGGWLAKPQVYRWERPPGAADWQCALSINLYHYIIPWTTMAPFNTANRVMSALKWNKLEKNSRKPSTNAENSSWGFCSGTRISISQGPTREAETAESMFRDLLQGIDLSDCGGWKDKSAISQAGGVGKLLSTGRTSSSQGKPQLSSWGPLDGLNQAYLDYLE